MSLVYVLLIALSLSMDAFAVSVTSGVTIRRMRVGHALTIAGLFGLFQALMPLMGWGLGRWALRYVSSIDHWVAFGLLAFVGGRMLWEARRPAGQESAVNFLSMRVLLSLAVATSIDAFAVGTALAMRQVAIVKPVLIIGSVTFVLSFAGTYIGEAFGRVMDVRKLEAAGGTLLIAIGIKIVAEHLCG